MTARAQPLDEFARESGFKDSDEMSNMIASVDLSVPEILRNFKKWRDEDGTKNGLQSILLSDNEKRGLVVMKKLIEVIEEGLMVREGMEITQEIAKERANNIVMTLMDLFDIEWGK